MKRTSLTAVAIVLLSIRCTLAGAAPNAATQFEKAVLLETADHDLDGAVRLYEQVADDSARDPLLAARALLRMGGCFERLGRPDDALNAYRRSLDLTAGVSRDVFDMAETSVRRIQDQLSVRASSAPALPASPPAPRRQYYAGVDMGAAIGPAGARGFGGSQTELSVEAGVAIGRDRWGIESVFFLPRDRTRHYGGVSDLNAPVNVTEVTEESAVFAGLRYQRDAVRRRRWRASVAAGAGPVFARSAVSTLNEPVPTNPAPPKPLVTYQSATTFHRVEPALSLGVGAGYDVSAAVTLTARIEDLVVFQSGSANDNYSGGVEQIAQASAGLRVVF